VVKDDAGTWKLAYTSNSELFAFLAVEVLPLVEVGDILQIVDAAAASVVNRLAINTPLLRGSVSAKASFEVTLHDSLTSLDTLRLSPWVGVSIDIDWLTR
jgi:hypothetical protein